MLIRHHILRVLTKLLIPLIMLFSLYVQFHGDYGPGGGFQAGVIFGAGIILYALIFGLSEAKRVFRPRVLEIFVALGLLIYGGVGIAAIAAGGNFLDYDVLAHDAHHGQHLGILLVELGVGITVAAVMATIFFAFAGRGRTDV
jgi:multicomponent Na+:H+ antiporter subunit B